MYKLFTKYYLELYKRYYETRKRIGKNNNENEMKKLGIYFQRNKATIKKKKKKKSNFMILK